MTHCNKASTKKTMALALLIIVAGVLLLLNGVGLIPYELSEIFLTWQMLLIVIGVYNLFSAQHKVGGLITIAVGGIFLYAKLYGLDYNVWNIIWPTVLIIVGASLLVGHNRRGKRDYQQQSLGATTDDEADVIDEVSIFSGTEKRITSQNFRGGRVVSIFGGSELNMSHAQLSTGVNQIEVLYIFGGSAMIVPSDWEVRMEVTSIFGGFSDKRYKTPEIVSDPAKTLIVRGLVIFGGGELKSY